MKKRKLHELLKSAGLSVSSTKKILGLKVQMRDEFGNKIGVIVSSFKIYFKPEFIINLTMQTGEILTFQLHSSKEKYRWTLSEPGLAQGTKVKKITFDK